jgi:hypothetical protein
MKHSKTKMKGQNIALSDGELKSIVGGGSVSLLYFVGTVQKYGGNGNLGYQRYKKSMHH